MRRRKLTDLTLIGNGYTVLGQNGEPLAQAEDVQVCLDAMREHRTAALFRNEDQALLAYRGTLPESMRRHIR